MKGKFSERVTPLITSAMKRACFSLSITQGPAIRKRLPEPIRTLSIWKEVVMFETTEDTEETEKTVTFEFLSVLRVICGYLSFPDLFRTMKHFHFRSCFFRSTFQSMLIRGADESLE